VGFCRWEKPTVNPSAEGLTVVTSYQLETGLVRCHLVRWGVHYWLGEKSKTEIPAET
jgi:hypothetical protein